ERTPAPASAHRRMVVRQLPRFALCWLGIAATWHAILVVESLISPRDALLALAGVAAVAFAAVALCRAHPEAPRVIPIVVVASVLRGVAERALCGARAACRTPASPERGREPPRPAGLARRLPRPRRERAGADLHDRPQRAVHVRESRLRTLLRRDAGGAPRPRERRLSLRSSVQRR